MPIAPDVFVEITHGADALPAFALRGEIYGALREWEPTHDGLECDDHDLDATHVTLFVQNKAVAYARILRESPLPVEIATELSAKRLLVNHLAAREIEIAPGQIESAAPRFAEISRFICHPQHERMPGAPKGRTLGELMLAIFRQCEREELDILLMFIEPRVRLQMMMFGVKVDVVGAQIEHKGRSRYPCVITMEGVRAMLAARQAQTGAVE
jgi:N-acyl-L-homoserine lactone synthetase